MHGTWYMVRIVVIGDFLGNGYVCLRALDLIRDFKGGGAKQKSTNGWVVQDASTGILLTTPSATNLQIAFPHLVHIAIF